MPFVIVGTRTEERDDQHTNDAVSFEEVFYFYSFTLLELNLILILLKATAFAEQIDAVAYLECSAKKMVINLHISYIESIVIALLFR